MEKIFIIERNINFDLICDFIDFYKQANPDTTYEVNILITGKKENGQIVGEVDPVFLSYVILFLHDFRRSSIRFEFEHTETYDRAFSLKHQLEQIRYLLGISPSRISLRGRYSSVDKTTGEVLAKQIFLDSNVSSLNQSKRFIPPIFIKDEESIATYFGKRNKTSHIHPLAELYKDKLANRIENRIGRQKLDLNKLSFFEIFLFRLLLSEDLYSSRRGKKGREKRDLVQDDTSRIKYYKILVSEIAAGIKELAQNIVEHSSTGCGVLTVRLYDKKRLLLLKNANEHQFFNERDEKYFLDINVIDFGNKSIRNKYLENMKSNALEYGEVLNIDFDNDIASIENRRNFHFKDFFILNFDKFKEIEHQQNKLISRIGLHYFTHLIKEKSSGFIKTASHDEGILIFNKRNGVVFESQQTSFIPYGTNYNCIIPLKINIPESQLLIAEKRIISKESTSINTFQELEDYNDNIIDYRQPVLNENTILLYKDKRDPSNTPEQNKYESIGTVYSRIRETITINNSNILVLDAECIEVKNESNWTRLLSALNFYYENLVVINLNYQVIKKIVNIRRSYTGTGVTFWNNNSRILFYGYKWDVQEKLRRFGSIVLTGNTEEIFDTINANVWRHHYSYRQGFFENESLRSPAHIPNEVYQSPIFNKDKLKYFELILTNEIESAGKFSLFEQSVQYSLNKNFEDHKDDNTNNKGYKIVDTHFRLGSKVHIEDFYYAKRLFQNSFFTTPLAYLVAKEIAAHISGLDKVTLIGYEDYSAFLVSSVRNVLYKFKSLEDVEINHNTISKEGNISRRIESMHQNIVIIVPIASSFSTSIKMRNQIIGIFERHMPSIKPNFVQPFMNVVLVWPGYKTPEIINDPLMNGAPKKIEIHDPILQQYNWKKIDWSNKIIDVRTFVRSESDISQKFFIPVKTKWHIAETCSLCFSKKITDEKCLIETGLASITPSLIFGMPKAKASSNPDSKLFLRDSLLYGNLRKGTNNYLYYLRTGVIIKNNERKIVDWLLKLKREIFANPEFANKKIVLVTPSIGSKSNFIDLVNEHIFEYTANCLTVSLKEDYLENSESLYADGLFKADKVIYVDDVLSTIRSFVETDLIVKYIRKKIKHGLGIDHCIALINRMSFDSEENLLLKLMPLKFSVQTTEGGGVDIEAKSRNHNNEISTAPKLFYFTKMNNPSIAEPNNIFPLQKERKRYKSLARTSSLDAIRQLFNLKRTKLKPKNIERSIPKIMPREKAHRDKKLFQSLVLDLLYTKFEFQEPADKDKLPDYLIDRNSVLHKYFGKDNTSFEQLIADLNQKLRSPINSLHKEIIDKYIHNLQFVILKIICSTPLVYYHQIRTSAFHWIMFLLEESRAKIEKLTDENLKDFFKVHHENYYSEYQKLNFLLKRSVQLKSNYIIHPEFFQTIRKLITLFHKNKHIIVEMKSANKIMFNAFYELYNESSNDINRNRIADYVNETKYALEWKDKVSIAESSNLLAKSKSLEPSERANPVDGKQAGLFDIEGGSYGRDSGFEAKFVELQDLPKYNYELPKKFILRLVAFAQELIHEHETKAQQLEDNIKQLNVERKDNFESANFQHYLRLLKLENTAVIERFWEYFKRRESDKGKRSISIFTLEQMNEKYGTDPRYKSIIKLQTSCQPSLISYLSLKSNLFNWSLDNSQTAQKELFEQGISTRARDILRLTSNIIGDQVEMAYFITNYQNKPSPLAEDLYIFDRYLAKSNLVAGDPNFIPELYRSDAEVSQSLAFKMISGYSFRKNAGGDVLSNLEVIKKDDTIFIRSELEQKQEGSDNHLNDKYSECKLLGRKTDYNILMIRVSDFKDQYNSGIANVTSDGELFSRAVLVFVLNRGERISEDRLRLLLLLRNSLGTFLKNQTSNNTFLELLKNKSRDEYQSGLRHGLENYFQYLNDIFNKVNKQGDNRSQVVFDTLNTAIKGQINAYDLSNVEMKRYTKIDILERIQYMLESKYIADKVIDSDNYTVDISCDSLEIETFIYDIVIVELIINIKRHSPNINPGVNIKIDNNHLLFENKIRESRKISSGKKTQGLILCKRICDDLDCVVFDAKQMENGNFIAEIRKS